MTTPTNSNPFASSANPLDTTSSTFGHVGSSMTNDSNVFPGTTSFGSSSSYPNQESVVSEISNAFDTVSNSLPLTSTTDTSNNPFTSSGNGAQNFGLKLRTAIDSMVGGVGGSGASIPGSGTGSESSGNGAPTTGNNGSGSSTPNLGPFSRILDIPGVSVENIVSGFGGGNGSGDPSSGGSGGFSGGGGAGTGSPFTNFGNPTADGSPLTGGTNPWSAINTNTAQAGAGNGSGSSPVAGGSSFGSGGGNPFTSGVSTPVAADAGTTAPVLAGASTGSQWTWDFSALEGSGDGNPFAGGAGGSNPFAGGAGGSNPFAGGAGGSNPFAGGAGGSNPFAGGAGGSNPFAGGGSNPFA